MEYRKLCAFCGKPFSTTIYTQAFCTGKCAVDSVRNVGKRRCSLCGKIFADDGIHIECNECRGDSDRKDPFKCHEAKRKEKAKAKKRKINQKHIASVNRKAREEHMTYGEYQAKLYLESMRNKSK